MYKYLFGKYSVYNWMNKDKVYFRGWFYYNNKLYNNIESVYQLFSHINKSELQNILYRLNGNYSILIETPTYVYIVVDRIKSFPLFYYCDENQIIVSDKTEKINKELNTRIIIEENLTELFATGFVTGPKTLYKDIYQVEGGQCIIINKVYKHIELLNYYLHEHKNFYTENMDVLCKELDEKIDNVFRRLINSINGRPIVLFLSGGYDSRLIALALKKLKYENVYCISFEVSDKREVIAAKNVAESINLHWNYLKVPKRFFKDYKYDEEFNKFVKNNLNGVSVQYIQGIIVKLFIDRELIPKDVVVLTGNSGDVVEGDHFDSFFKIGQSYNKVDIINSILKNHYLLYGKKFLEKHKDVLGNFVENLIEDKEYYTYNECQDILEKFNWRERQSKYVINDIRCYDEFLELDWRLPLWDNEFVEFWLRVPTDLRCNRKLYYYYVKNENYITANTTTKKRQIINIIKNKCIFFIEILYPFVKLKEYLVSPFYIVNFKEFLTILNITKGYQTNCISSTLYFTIKYNFKEEYKCLKKILGKK